MEGRSAERDLAKMFRAAESCSVCLDAVNDSGERSIAKLKCGHHFHLDCIGSAFNAKGAMQCPNCRHVENGQWLYANGSRCTDDFSFEEFSYEDDNVYHTLPTLLAAQETLNHLEWCPYQHGSLAPGGSSYEHVQFHLPSLRELDGPTRSLPAEVVVNVSYNYSDSGGAVSSPSVCPYLDAQARLSSQGTENSRVQPPVPGGPARSLDPSAAASSGSPITPLNSSSIPLMNADPIPTLNSDGDFFTSRSSIWRPRRRDSPTPLSEQRTDPSIYAEQSLSSPVMDILLAPPSSTTLYPDSPTPHERLYWAYTETERGAHSQGHSLPSNYSAQHGHNEMYTNSSSLPGGPCPRPRFAHGQVGSNQSQAQNPSRRSAAPIGSNRRSRQNGFATPSMPGGRMDHSHSPGPGEISGELRRRASQSWTDLSLSIGSEPPVPGLDSHGSHGSGYQSGNQGFVPWRRDNTSGPSTSLWTPGQLWHPPRSSSGLPQPNRYSHSDFIEGHGSSFGSSQRQSEPEQPRHLPVGLDRAAAEQPRFFSTLGLERAAEQPRLFSTLGLERAAAGGSPTPSQLHLSAYSLPLRPRS